MTIPTQGNGLSPQKRWQVDIYTEKDQTIPHTFYDATMASLREQVYTWLVTAQPTYVRSKAAYKKEGKHWSPLYTENNERLYREFAGNGLDIQKGPEYEEGGFIDGKFNLEHVKVTLKHDNPDIVNNMLQRGWHILTLEKGEESGRTFYVLGHVEEGAR